MSKPISEVEVGDLVLATDPETGRTEAREVTDLVVGEGVKTMVAVAVDTPGPDDGVLLATDSHPFWDTVDQQWVDAADLTTEDQLIGSDGDLLPVAGVRISVRVQTVYNLTVADIHTYYVLAGDEPVLVHNSSCGGGLEVLRNWSGQRFQFGNQTFILDRSGMTHILERHAPSYWNGSTKAQQSFFARDMTLSDIQGAIGSVMRQNRDTLISRGSQGMYQLRGNVNGTDYVLGINNGRVGQFYPVNR